MFMKKLLALVTMVVTTAAYAATSTGSTCSVVSKTFFMPRSTGSDLALQHAGAHQFICRHEPAKRFFLNISAFYQESTNSSDIAHYFLPTNKRELIIKGAFADGPRDISATWLQIAGKNSNGIGNNVPAELEFPGNVIAGTTNRGNVELYLNEFSSIISIDPTYRSFGTLIQYYQNLDTCLKGLWYSIDFPVVQVETETNIRERDIQNAATTRSSVADFIIDDGTPARGNIKRHERASLAHNLNAIEAFNNPLWRYGKIYDGVQKLVGIADMQCKLGYHIVKLKSFRIDTYAHLSIPTGHKPKLAFMFEPMVGNGGHWGIGAGVGLDFIIGQGKNFNLGLCTNLDYQYLIGTNQRRSMDLITNGEWSRYLLVVDTKNEPDPNKRTLQPGINFFTRKVHVNPNHEINAVGSIKMGFNRFFIEGGYNLWFKSGEAVTLRECLPEGLAIAANHFGARKSDEAFEVRTFSQATISSHIASATSGLGIPADATHTDDAAGRPVTLVSSQLDLTSAEHPKRLSHKIFLATGIQNMWCNVPVQIAIGGSYEFAQKNRSLDLWSIYLKFNINV